MKTFIKIFLLLTIPLWFLPWAIWGLSSIIWYTISDWVDER